MAVSRLRVLGVDNENNVRCSLRTLFNEHDIVFIDAASAAEGLEIVRLGGHFDVIISDYQLPGMNGIGFLSAVRDLRPETLRILLRVPSREDMVAFDTGIVHFRMSKPWDNMELLALIEAWIALNR